MKYLFLDIETTNANIEDHNNEILEFGYILVEKNNQNKIKELEREAFFIQNQYPILEPHISKITNNDLKGGLEKKEAFERIQKLINDSDFIVAHNGLAFDFPMLEKNNIDFNSKYKLDTLMHIPLKNTRDSQQLKYKCFDYEVYVDQSQLHTALYDVELTYKLALKYGLDNILQNIMKKNCKIYVKVDYKDKDKINKNGLGFEWDKNRRMWYIIIDEKNKYDYIEELKTKNFIIEIY